MEEKKVKYLFRELNHEGEDGVGYNWLLNAIDELEDHKQVVRNTGEEINYRNQQLFKLVNQKVSNTFKDVIVEFGGQVDGEFYINMNVVEKYNETVNGEQTKGRLVPAYTFTSTLTENTDGEYGGHVYELYHHDKWVMLRDKGGKIQVDSNGRPKPPVKVGKVIIDENYVDGHEVYTEDGLKEWFMGLMEFIISARV